jgi:hypothetical protein
MGRRLSLGEPAWEHGSVPSDYVSHVRRIRELRKREIRAGCSELTNFVFTDDLRENMYLFNSYSKVHQDWLKGRMAVYERRRKALLLPALDLVHVPSGASAGPSGASRPCSLDGMESDPMDDARMGDVMNMN